MIKMNLQIFGGRGGGSGMTSSSTSGGSSFMSNRQNMEDYAIATGGLDIGSEEETRAYLRTPEGREALNEFMEGEREAGLTEREMRQAIDTVVGNTYRANDVPSRIQSFTSKGSGLAGDYESKTYVTRKGDAIKTTTKYSDGRRTTTTDMKNYGDRHDRTRTQYEDILAKRARSEINAGVKVTKIDGKKKKRR